MTDHPVLAFPRAEYDRRMALVRHAMRERAIDALIVDECEALGWLTGTANTLNLYRACIVPADGPPAMVLRQLDAGPLRQSSWIEDVRPFMDWEDQVERVVACLGDRGLAAASVGMDFGSYALTVRRFARYQELLPQARIVDAGNLLNEARLVKSAPELAVLREAAAVADAAMARAIEVVRPGGSERDAWLAARGTFDRMGAEDGKALVTAGVGDGFVHGPMRDRPLAAGDVVHMELAPMLRNYSARLMRPAVVAPTDRQCRTAEMLVALQDRQIAAMKAGAEARDVDAILREGVLRAGLRDRFDNLCGYTLGYYHWAGPRTSDFTRVFGPHVDYRLAAGMVFHMWVAADGLAFSESVLVTDAGGERLTRIERRLFDR